MNYNQSFKQRIAATMFVAAICSSHEVRVRAGQPYVVSESTGGRIWRILDSNNDGDALDVGERLLWADGFTSPRGMNADFSAVYVTEEGLGDGTNQVVRLFDANSDGDALDVGDRIVWLDGLDDPRDLSHGLDGASYLSEFDNNQVWRLIDANSDGDVLDVGERLLYADGINGPQTILPRAGALLVAAEVGDQIHRLVDRNGDGDALDVAENLVITPNYDQLVGLMDDNAGGFYFSSFSTDVVYHARDNNGDGDMLDVAEVLSYADSVFGFLDGPSGLVALNGGGFLLASAINNQLKLVRDRNGDGDALDIGDVVLFADGITAPADIVLLPLPMSGDYNQDGKVDAADYVLWRKLPSALGSDPGGYNTWFTHFGESNVSTGSAAVPEPAILAPLILAATVICARRCRAGRKPSSLRRTRSSAPAVGKVK
jgi:hypothetical protein